MRITESKLRQIIREEARRLVEMAPGVAAPSITVDELHEICYSILDGAAEQDIPDEALQEFILQDERVEDIIKADPQPMLDGYPNKQVVMFSQPLYAGGEMIVHLKDVATGRTEEVGVDEL
jgi:hypothetical protein